MKKAYLMGLALVLALVGNSASNASRGYQIQLGGGTAKPGQTLAVDAAKLLSHVNYQIECQVDATAATMMHFLVGGVLSTDINNLEMNSKYIGNISITGLNAALNAGSNNYKVGYLITQDKNNAKLFFLNLDDSAVVTVSHCVATPV